MASSKLFGVAVSTLRNRGHSDIMPNSVFGVADGEKNEREFHRLMRDGHIREPSEDELKLYQARVKDGEIPEQLLGATAEEAEAAGIAVSAGAVNTGAASEPARTEPKASDGGAKPAGSGGKNKPSADDL